MLFKESTLSIEIRALTDIKYRLMDGVLIAGKLKAVISQEANIFSDEPCIGIDNVGSTG